MYSSILFLTSALQRGEGSVSRRGRTLPPGKTRYPFYRRLCGPQGRSGQVQKISPSQGFDSRTVQPVGSRYTDYATRPTCVSKVHIHYSYRPTLFVIGCVQTTMTKSVGLYGELMCKDVHNVWDDITCTPNSQRRTTDSLLSD